MAACALRGLTTAAPLKQRGDQMAAGDVRPLRGLTTAAPLKQDAVFFDARREFVSPRSHDRGPVEAHSHACESQACDAISPRSHDRGPVEASYVDLDEKVPPALRGLTTAAPLKLRPTRPRLRLRLKLSAVSRPRPR